MLFFGANYLSLGALYNTLNQATNLDQAGFAYDRQGNMVERHDGAGAYYDFDPENRLTAVRDGSSNVVARYWYGPSGVRLAKAVGGVTNYFLYGSAGLLAEFNATGGVVRSYGYLPGAVFGGAPLYMKTPTTTAFFVLDHQGAPAMLVEGDGTIAWRLRRDAYGRATVDPSSRLVCPLRASSQYADEESGLNYNLFRYYDPVLGRYINRDPIGEAGGINLYGFCANSPVEFIDPLGLFTACDALRFVPVIGSGMDAYESFKSGHWGMMLLHTGLMLFDATGVGALAKGIAVGGFKLASKSLLKEVYKDGRSMAFKNVRKRMRSRGLVTKDVDTHHWLISQEMIKKYPQLGLEKIANKPWNLMPDISDVDHALAHGPSLSKRLYYGTPAWAKVAGASFASHEIGSLAGDILEVNNENDDGGETQKESDICQ